jgi:ankyrin repeat protein
MTLQRWKMRYDARMRTILFGPALLILCAAGAAFGQEAAASAPLPAVRGAIHGADGRPLAAPVPTSDASLKLLLRDALFEEEASRDLTKAAAGYEALLTKWAEQRTVAATALYRLAEVRRKQDKKEEAIALYRRFLTEFADVEPQAKMCQENLLVLGAPATAPAVAGKTPVASSDEAAALARAQKLSAESPDLLRSGEFTNACKQGWLSVVQFLISKEIFQRRDGLLAAAEGGRLAVVRELLALKPPPDELTAALSKSINFGFAEVLKTLLEAGASPEGADPVYPPLVSAIRNNADSIIHLLLEHKASVNPPDAQVPPLVAAAAKRDAALLKRLLDLGATVDQAARGGQNVSPARGRTDMLSEPGATALLVAAEAGNAECVSLLLKAKADPNKESEWGTSPLFAAASVGSVEVVDMLLAAGANPKEPAKKSRADWSPLFPVVRGSGAFKPGVAVALVKSLLNADADPNANGEGDTTPMAWAGLNAQGEVREEIISLLAAKGGDPEEVIRYVLDASVRVPLLRKYRYPKLGEKPQVTLIQGDTAAQAILAERILPDEQPAPLGALLLAWNSSGGWKDNTGQSSYTPYPDWTQLNLFRKGTDVSTITVKAGGEFPVLQWGDVIEVVSRGWETPRQQTNGGGSAQRLSSVELPNETAAIFRSTQVVHVKYRQGEMNRDLALRGNVLAYDPGAAEAPLITTSRLVRMLAGGISGFVKVQRHAAQGGGALNWHLDAANESMPEEGDEITFEPSMPEGEVSRNVILVRAAGNPGVYSETVRGPATLVQVLANMYRGWGEEQLLPRQPSYPNAPSRTPEQRAALLAALTPQDIVTNLTANGISNGSFYVPWPDWSAVKVRQAVAKSGPTEEKQDAGGDAKPVTLGPAKTIDLAAAMRAITPDSNAEEARKLDIALSSGDVVEIPMLKEHPAGPWPGLDEAAARFFQKATETQVTMVDVIGNFRSVTRRWLPPRWVATSAGVIPVPQGVGANGNVHGLTVQSLMASAAPGLTLTKVIHGNVEITDFDSFAYFPQSGDVVHSVKITTSPPLRVIPSGAQPQASPPSIPQPNTQGRRRVTLPGQNP